MGGLVCGLAGRWVGTFLLGIKHLLRAPPQRASGASEACVQTTHHPFTFFRLDPGLAVDRERKRKRERECPVPAEQERVVKTAMAQRATGSREMSCEEQGSKCLGTRTLPANACTNLSATADLLGGPSASHLTSLCQGYGGK